jgi:hypothetical protein
MRRRYVAALAVGLPVAAIAITKYYFPISFDALAGYMVVVALVFKSALLSFWAVFKLKVLAYLKGLTFAKGLVLIVKRWFLDNIFARWLKRNILDHIMVGVKEFRNYFKALNFRSKLQNVLAPALIGAIVIALLYYSGFLGHILLLTEFKVFVISISKTLLLILTKIFGFVVNSWISPILEVFALSYFFSWLEKKLGKENWLVRILNSTGQRLNRIFFYILGLNKKYVDPILNDKVSAGSQRIGSAMTEYVNNKKVVYEYEQFDRLEKSILDRHIDAYHHFEGMERITDKKKLYSIINERTNDKLEIVAYISRNDSGHLVSEDVDDSFYHDIFFLEGLASSSEHGVDIQKDIDPDSTDFWVLNTSKYPIIINSHSGNVPQTYIFPHSSYLIKTRYKTDYADGDIYGIFEGTDEKIVAV